MNDYMFDEDDYESELNDIVENLTGETWEDAADDETGCYFENHKWVSGKGICDAMRKAYDLGVEQGRRS
jgi:hypothetical protein